MSLNRLTPTARLLARTFNGTPLTSRQLVPSLNSSAALLSRGAATTAAPPTVKMTADENLEMLNKQRSLRPSSPHFTIYQPQLTWLGSIANRITGVGLSAGLYAYALAYVTFPLIGYGDLVTSAHLTSLAASAPFWLKLSLKAPIAAAFNYHTFNGLRHLGWDKGYFISVQGCYTSGYIVLGSTALATIGLCLI